MKTGHSSVVGMHVIFPVLQDTVILDFCSAREPNVQGGPGNNLTVAVM